MSDTPPPIRPVPDKDAEHLRLLAVFHFIFGGLGVLGYLFLGAHFAFMNMIFNNPEMWKAKNGNPANPPPPELFAIFKWFYLFFALMLTVGIVLNILSGMYLLKRKNRTFSIVVAGLDCLQMPFGTLLGIFTIVTLMKESVRTRYTDKP